MTSNEARALAACFEVAAATYGRRCYEAGRAGAPADVVTEGARALPGRVLVEVAERFETYVEAFEAAKADALAARALAWARRLTEEQI